TERGLQGSVLLNYRAIILLSQKYHPERLVVIYQHTLPMSMCEYILSIKSKEYYLKYKGKAAT
ncbi:hypothetical protein RCL84_22195, partial [Escherichia coli]|nr:hypothetical protein [Escherichia coli]